MKLDDLDSIVAHNTVKLKLKELLLSHSAVTAFGIDWTNDNITDEALDEIAESTMNFIKTKFASIQKKG